MIGLGFGNFQSGAGFVGLLDTYPNAAAAYSVRLLSSTYSGALVEVRRSSDNAVTDVNPDANNEISFSSTVSAGGDLSTWIGSDDGFVRTWYDQSGNSKDLIQFTSSNQPKIISSGAFEVIKAKPSILGLDNSLLTVPSSTAYFKFLHDGTKSFVSNVIETPSNVSNLEFIWLTNQTGSSDVGADLWANAGDYRQFTRNGTTSSQRNENTWGATANSHETLSLIFDAGNATAADRLIARINGGLDLANNTRTFAPSTANSTNDFNLFNYFVPSSNFGFTGKYQELIFWDSDQSSNREGIETNQNTYYSIY